MTKTPPTKRSVTTYYVATLARYVLVEAESDEQARRAGEKALAALCPNLPIAIRAVRAATLDEIELWKWHHDITGRQPT